MLNCSTKCDESDVCMSRENGTSSYGGTRYGASSSAHAIIGRISTTAYNLTTVGPYPRAIGRFNVSHRCLAEHCVLVMLTFVQVGECC